MTQDKLPLVEIEDVGPERIEHEEEVNIGQWYWYRDKSDDEEETDEEDDCCDEESDKAERAGKGWLGCITHIGSNCVEVEGPTNERNSTRTARIHMDSFDRYLTRELDHHGVILGRIDGYRSEVKQLMAEVNEITKRLGVSPRLGLPAPQVETYALAITTGAKTQADEYKASLVRAKDEELPALFKKIEKANSRLAIWMQVETIPMKAHVDRMKSCVSLIDGRIFNVALYAGLTEDITQCSDGEPAPFDEKLHLMQRRLYMDEECLLEYETGGMEYSDISEFDEWIARPEHRDRLLPFPRCMVAMRVRREKKSREAGNLWQMLVNIELKELDKTTFLYIRNGEQLFRMNCDLEFEEMIFPNKGEFDPSQPMMFCSDFRDYEFMTVADYDERCAADDKRVEDDKRWKRNNPLKKFREAWIRKHRVQGRRGVVNDPSHHPRKVKVAKLDFTSKWNKTNPHRDDWGDLATDFDKYGKSRNQWQSFDPGSLYYDEGLKTITEEIEQYNRIAIIIQGIYDRSEVLHPHPPVKTWEPEGFASAIQLVYDADRALHDGDAPNYDAYCAKLRESITANSVLIGQEDIWMKRVQAKEDEKYRSYHSRYDRTGSDWKPQGDPGPGFMARPVSLKKNGEVIFRWIRDRRQTGWRNTSGDSILASESIPTATLFNVSAYTPGDFKRFFQDPRTRTNYLQWAHAMLMAEEYYAGNEKPKMPAVKDAGGPSLTEIASRILMHLLRMEKDPEVNVTWLKNCQNEDVPKFWRPRAWRKGQYCKIEHHYYYNGDSVTKGRAWNYLKWLDAGHSGIFQDYENAKFAEDETARKKAERILKKKATRVKKAAKKGEVN